MAPGTGTVYTFTVTYQNQARGFAEACPYVMAYVDLDEGVRVLTNIVGCEPDEVTIGMAVEADFATGSATTARPSPFPGSARSAPVRSGSLAMILDLHTHSIKSDDGRAKVENYCKWIRKKELPLDGFVLTEHRQFDDESDYRHLEDEYGLLILKASEVETDYGHVLVFGVNDDLVNSFDFAKVDNPLPEVLAAAGALRGLRRPLPPRAQERRPVRPLRAQGPGRRRPHRGGPQRGQHPR